MSLAFVFPGQGSQSVGMLAELAASEALVQQTFAEASQVLGYDLWQKVSEGPVEDLNQTHITQPAMLAAGIAVWRVWQQRGGTTPALMAGHSLGEYTALVAAGALGFADGIRLVEARGKLMQQAVPAGSGAMAAILGLDDAQVIAVCEQAAQGEIVSAVNFNAIGQVVIAGQSAAVARAIELAKEAGAKRAMPLPVSVPSHCALMQSAATELAKLLDGIAITAPSIPVINNADVQQQSEPTAIRDALVRQLYSPVRWVETVQHMHGAGVDTLVECGPGKVLVGLNKRIVKEMKALAIVDPASLDAALAELA
ncbi:MAG: ACP S-malonyltransferase [Chromatiales bacterium]|nr:ACP S-malonyltransferase [Gammaproteobacteria bacterium]MBW6476678.1 ACP S-malonyltransferase [Chromatiales bacterium]